MSLVKDAAQAVLKKALEHAPDAWMPGGQPDPLIARPQGIVGTPLSRLDGPPQGPGASALCGRVSDGGHAVRRPRLRHDRQGSASPRSTRPQRKRPTGVVLVMSHRNAPRLKPMPLFMSKSKAAGGDNLPVMQDDRIHWNGEPIAVVLAETQEQADHAASLIRASYDAEPATTSFEAAKARGLKPGTFQGEPLKLEIGDAEAALAKAPHQVDCTYRTPRHNHNAIELHAVTLAWKGEELTVHDASQGVAHTAWSLGEMFGLDEKQVHITSPYVGGGFGGKTLWRHQVLAAAAAKLAGRPVRLVLTREGVYRTVGGRTLTEQRVALGADPDGRLAALIHTGAVAMTAHNALPEPFILPARSTYAAGSFKLNVETAQVDMLANTFMRAPGESVGTFGLESAIDELAIEMGLDPIELRIRNEPDKDPTNGRPFSSRHIVEAWRSGAERFGWSRRSVEPRQRREGEWWVGMGCATATYPYYRMPGGAARIFLGRDGRARVEVAAHEMGMGTATAQTQVAAERLGLPLARVTFCHGDSRFPGLVLAGGSQQTASIGASVRAAQEKLVGELLKLVGKDSPLNGLKTDEVEARDGGLASLDEPARFESYTDILARGRSRRGDGRSECPAATRDPALVDALARRAVLRSARQRRHRGAAGEPLPGFVRLRPHPQSENGEQPIPRWHCDGPRPGAHGRNAVRRAQWPHHESQPRRISRAGAPRRSGDRCHLDRYPRSARANGSTRNR